MQTIEKTTGCRTERGAQIESKRDGFTTEPTPPPTQDRSKSQPRSTEMQQGRLHSYEANKCSGNAGSHNGTCGPKLENLGRRQDTPHAYARLRQNQHHD